VSPAEAPHEPLARQLRREFPIFREKVYLNSCSLGALSERVARALAAFAAEWGDRGAAAWYDTWLDGCDDLRRRLAALLGAAPGEVALAPSVSGALATLASALDFARRPRVVTTELDFPTVAYAFLAKRRLGVEVVVCPSDDRCTVDLQRIEDAVDERTAAVVTSHVYYATGAVQDLRALAEIAHRKGALCIVDAYQSIGQVPVDAKATGVDALCGGALKWLLGGPGCAFLYVRDELARALEPTVVSWFGTADPFAFDPRTLRLRADARRFELGTPAVAAVYAARAGLSIIEEVGVPAIRQRIAALVDDLVARARAAGLAPRVATDPERRSGIVRIEHPDPAAAVAHLARRGVIVDHRPGAVRISPHVYNTCEDNEAAVAALAETPATSA
jgi:kynureninase